jgi:divalent metal cation (Fe/Co/Zn/Cd) transporter
LGGIASLDLCLGAALDPLDKDRAVTDDRRHRLVSAATRWSAASLVWATVVGATSLVAGLASSSVALVGFGANSMLDGSASAVLVWRFRHERMKTAEVNAVERRAAHVVGVAMIGVALYVGLSAISALAGHSEPEQSLVGIILTGASVCVFPVLARAKLRLAPPLGSRALRGDGVLSLAGAVLAAATLTDLILNAAFDWWWADAGVALSISTMLLIEGLRTFRFRGEEPLQAGASGPSEPA